MSPVIVAGGAGCAWVHATRDSLGHGGTRPSGEVGERVRGLGQGMRDGDGHRG